MLIGMDPGLLSSLEEAVSLLSSPPLQLVEQLYTLLNRGDMHLIIIIVSNLIIKINFIVYSDIGLICIKRVITGIGLIAIISDCYRSYNQFHRDLRELGPPQ